MGRKLGHFVTGGKYGFVGGVGGLRERSGKDIFERIGKWIYAEEPGKGQKAIGVTNSSELRDKWVTEERGSRFEEEGAQGFLDTS